MECVSVDYFGGRGDDDDMCQLVSDLSLKGVCLRFPCCLYSSYKAWAALCLLFLTVCIFVLKQESAWLQRCAMGCRLAVCLHHTVLTQIMDMLSWQMHSSILRAHRCIKSNRRKTWWQNNSTAQKIITPPGQEGRNHYLFKSFGFIIKLIEALTQQWTPWACFIYSDIILFIV